MASTGSDAWTEVGSSSSVLGGAPLRRPHATDVYQWGRDALSFVDMSAQEFDDLAARIGSRAAGEVLLLAVPKECGKTPQKWLQAKGRGIPWQESMVGISSSMDISVENKTIALQIPPCIASSSVGEQLAQRILSDSWAFHKTTEVDESWLAPTPVNNMLKHERRLGRRGEPVHVCAMCGGKGTRKSNRCLQTYYCTPVCQELHWKRHRTTCIPMESSLQEYLAIAKRSSMSA